MNQILSDDEIEKVLGFTEFTCASTKMTLESVARAIEQAVMAKLREQNEPVAVFHTNGHVQFSGLSVPIHKYTTDKGWKPLFEHPAPSAPEVSNQLSGNSGQVTEGYQLVPIEPTEAMLEAAWALNLDIEGIRQHCTNRYKEMLAAARSE